MSYTLETISTAPWGSIDAPTVTCTDWGVSCSHIDGAELHVYRVLTDDQGRATGEVIHHDLNKSLHASVDAAKQTAYEAGLLAYWIKTPKAA